MSFEITGLSPRDFSHLFGLSGEELSRQNIVGQTTDRKPGFPCRITLEDAEPGETVLLLIHQSHLAETPYASRYAIHVREGAVRAKTLLAELPPVCANRPIALRLFDERGMLIGADMGMNGELKSKIDEALARPEVAYIYAHNAMHGWFSAEIRRTA